MYKKTTNLFAKVLLGCCLLATYSGTWASPEEELDKALLKGLGDGAIAFKEINYEWDGGKRWVQLVDERWKISEDFETEMGKCSTNLAGFAFEEPAGSDFPKRFESEGRRLMTLSGRDPEKDTVSEEESFALLAYLSYVPPGCPISEITNYKNKDILASPLRFIPLTYWDMAYKEMHENPTGYNFLQRLNSGKTPTDPGKIDRKLCFEIRGIGEAYVSATTMKIVRFKTVSPESLPTEQHMVFPVSTDKVVERLVPVISFLTGCGGGNPLDDLMELDKSLNFPAVESLKDKVTEAVNVYCSEDGGKTVKSLEALLALGACELDRDLKALYRLAMLDIYLRDPGTLYGFKGFRDFNDIISMYTGSELKQPLYFMRDATPAERATVARENLSKDRELRKRMVDPQS